MASLLHYERLLILGEPCVNGPWFSWAGGYKKLPIRRIRIYFNARP